MKDMKFVIIILLMFFGLEIMAQINDYDYNVNKTGIMYQENNNIALNENNRYYDYDIDFDLDESYLHYSPVKKGGLLDSLYNDKSKNLARPDLTGKQYLGNGVYRLSNINGLVVDYDIYNGIFIMNGVNSSGLEYILFNVENNTEYTLSFIAVSGTYTGGVLRFNIKEPDINLINQYDENTSKQSTFTTTTQTQLNINMGAGRTFNNYQFKLQLEKGNTATAYQVPYILALQIAFNGTNQVEYINPFEEQIIEINDINNVNNIDFELLNTKNPVVFNFNITTNPNIPFVRFYNNQTKLLYDFTDVKEMNSIGNTLIGSRSNILNGFDFALDLVNTFYEGFQKLFNTKLIENIRDALSRVWPLLPPKWPWLR